MKWHYAQDVCANISFPLDSFSLGYRPGEFQNIFRNSIADNSQKINVEKGELRFSACTLCISCTKIIENYLQLSDTIAVQYSSSHVRRSSFCPMIHAHERKMENTDINHMINAALNRGERYRMDGRFHSTGVSCQLYSTTLYCPLTAVATPEVFPKTHVNMWDESSRCWCCLKLSLYRFIFSGRLYRTTTRETESRQTLNSENQTRRIALGAQMRAVPCFHATVCGLQSTLSENCRKLREHTRATRADAVFVTSVRGIVHSMFNSNVLRNTTCSHKGCGYQSSGQELTTSAAVGMQTCAVYYSCCATCEYKITYWAHCGSGSWRVRDLCALILPTPPAKRPRYRRVDPHGMTGGNNMLSYFISHEKKVENMFV